MSKTAPLSIRISPELKKELEKLANSEKRSLSSLVEIILENYINNIKNND
ncbi:MAG: ribbon-helix-helix protein, CopG family [Proteobacteria bacterium]|nr:ribbon-helix-helix protein, CopG family [Pseudomonadota bacterium]